MKRAGLVMMIAACGSGGATPDAGGDPNCLMDCMTIGEVASCEGDMASTVIELGGGSTSLTLCHAPGFGNGVTCQSCARDAHLETTADEVGDYIDHPEVLCAETPEAAVGDFCHAPVYTRETSYPYVTVSGDVPCLPTRARLNPDGTVAGQDYLACDPSDNRCVAAAAPTITGYFETCAPAVLAQYGTSGAVGVVHLGAASGALGGPAPEACLIAWDATAQAPTSGMTIECIGDWDCPAGSLCDDEIPKLSAPYPIAVCKPGPRGTLTPAMLTP